MELAIAAGSLRAAYQLLIFGIKVDQVPDAVRRCIELVRTCHYDLNDLIRLRNESLPILESKPAILDRVNTIIERARASLFEVARLVEKLRPEAHDGSTPFMRRLEWLFISSGEFKSQEPLISRQHSSVIAELNFLRQLVLLAPLVNRPTPGEPVAARTDARPMVAWENVALLDEMLGGGNKQIPRPAGGLSTESPASVSSHVSHTPSVGNPSASATEPPPPYASPTPGFANTSWSPSGPAPGPVVYQAYVPDVHKTSVLSTGQTAIVPKWKKTSSATGGLQSLFDDLKSSPQQNPNITGGHEPRQQGLAKKTQTTFDSTGAAFLFGDSGQSPRPLTPNWNIGGGQQNPWDSNSSCRISSPSGSSFSLDGANLLLQSPISSVSDHQMGLAKPFSTIPQHLIHRQDGVELPSPLTPPSIQRPELPTNNTLSWNLPPAEMPAEPPPTRLPSDNPQGSQDPAAAAAYATLREHWEPENYLTGQPHMQAAAPGCEATAGLGATSPGMAELSAVVFPPDPSELES